ncbi:MULTISPECIES: VOC family protein [Pseudomonas]|uniref:VOC family protein n=1 Tax=Pseudomonas nitroreducens TaxID=46680 RepID=UPI001E44AD55|nr:MULTISPECIES: VOC family protein [Pseudomonas]MCE4070887.1 VOC family protein [Pseudomonas nitritireducens]MCE4080243.1 VOC family protein [Pseudomonas nitroreducens]
MLMNAYLVFDGNCEEAFRYYAEVLRAELPALMRFSDAPGCEDMPEALKNRVIHVRLEVDGHVLMGSDASPQCGQYEGGKGVSITLNVDSKAEARRLFDALGKGGKVTMPLDQTFWAELFGAVEDRFGVPWMINCEKEA